MLAPVVAHLEAPGKWALILAAVAFPRLMVSGSLPSTDEGVLAYFAQIAHASLASGNGLPDTGPLVLYSILLSWVFALDTNHIVALRLLDLAVALVASSILYDVIVRESRSRLGGALVALVVLFTMNLPVFIQAGFKNSMFAAYIPLFAAMRIAQRAQPGDDRAWLACGALAALGVLLRETFVPLAAVGAAAVFVAHGRRAGTRFILGGVAAGLAVLLVVIAARGGARSLLDAYREAGALYASMSALRGTIVYNSAMASVRDAQLPLLLAALSLVLVPLSWFWPGRRGSAGPFVFWLAAALVPLIEPVSKIGFPYHFAVCLPGIAGLGAVAWRELLAGRAVRTRLAVAASLAALAGWMFWPKFASLQNGWPSTRAMLASAAEGRWPAEAVAKSNYLLAADAIAKASPAGGTLSVSGFMYALFPLTGLLPRAYELSHLTASLIGLGMDEAAFGKALMSCPPDVLMTTTRTDWPGAAALERAVRGSGLYEQAAVITIDPTRNYGNFGGTVYRRSRPAPCDRERPR